MSDGVRDRLARNPWIGWVVALALLGLSAWLYFARTKSDSPYSPDRMTEMLTIRYTDTDEIEKIPRGRLDQMLRRTGGELDPTKGITNPKTGKPTGFLVDEDEWSEMIKRINAEKAEVKAKTGQDPKIAPRKEMPTPPEIKKGLEGLQQPK